MTAIPKTSSRAARLLLIGCSSLALSVPSLANEVIFSSSPTPVQLGQRTSQSSGVTQISLTGGGTVSIVDAAEYTINPDGSIDLYSGSITISGCDACDIVVRMPEGLEAQVAGEGSSASFSVAANGEASGHTLGGEVRVGQAGRGMRKFREGMMWSAEPGRAPRRSIANTAVAQPEPGKPAGSVPPQVAAIGGDAGPIAAALNGMPVTLGDGLAAAGASSDIIDAGRRLEAAVANPSIETFPSGDFALLIAAAAQLEGAYGGRPFNAAQADVIRTYLRFLASGGAQADFLVAYSGFVLDYLDLIRAGGVPSGFASGAASAADIDAYLAFIARTGAIADLAARDRALADAYLAFIASGGNRDLFAASFTDLTRAYFAFLRAGGVPTDFTGASQSALAQSIAFLRQSGLDQQLSAADRALITAFLENGGIAFASQFQTALDAYFAYLASGRLPSDYDALDQATLRAYLETLANTGLLDAVLADRAAFYSDYLAFLRAGGNVDAFAGLPANIFAGYAVQLDAYFDFLAAGNLPSQFTAADIAQLQSFILELQAAGALERFLGADQAAFFASFGEFVADGGAFDNFAGLNANIFVGYARDLRAYFEFLSKGGIPSGYTILSQETIAAYIAALEEAGATDRFLLDLTDFYQAYFQFVLGGGNPDNFAGLPIPPDFPAFADALNAYAAFLAANGLPSDYSDEDIARLQEFFAAVLQSGQVNSLLGANGDLLTAYFAFLEAGGQIDGFTGLPIYADYIAALNAYFEFLANGGLPSEYTALDLAILEAYLAALAALQGGLAGFADLNNFFLDYYEFLLGGGDPDQFAGLPGNGGGNGGGDPALATTIPEALFVVSFGGGSISPRQATLEVAQNGQILDAVQNGSTVSLLGAPNIPFDERGWEVLDAGRFGNVVAYTSYLDPDSQFADNFVFNFLGGVRTIVLPHTGIVNYSLLGGAAPTEQNTALGSEGFFTGNLAVAFGGSSPRVGLDFEVTSHGTTYATGTPGGAADPLNGGLTVNSSGAFAGFFPAVVIEGEGCVTAAVCSARVDGGLFGENASHVGFVYFLNDTSDLSAFRLISGSAVFGRDGTALAGLGTPSDTSGNIAFDFAYQGGYAPAGPGFFARGVYPRTNQFGLNLDVIRNNQTATNRPASLAVEIEPSGALSRITARTTGENVVDRGTTTAFDVYGDASLLIGRWSDGTFAFNVSETESTISANQGYHYLLTSAWDAAPNFPMGRVEYELLAATSPTLIDGSLSPGVFDADLAIIYGAAPRVAIDGSITFTGATGFVYSFATEGGFAGEGTPFSISSPSGPSNLFSGGFFSFQAPGTTNDGRSGAFQAEGQIVDPQGDRLGLVYEATIADTSAQNSDTIQGAAIFGAIEGNGPDVTLANQSIAFANKLIGDDVHTLSLVTYNSDGIPIGYVANIDPNEALTSGDMTLADTGTAGSGTLAWTRWTDGTPGGFWYNVTLESVGPNGGYHVIAGAPLTNLPTEGAVFYDLIGFTMPTRHDESTSTGSVAGGAAVVFGSSPVVALDLEITSGADVFDLFTTGRLTDPSQSTLAINPVDGMFHTLGRVGNFNGSTNAVFVETTSSFCASTCSGFVEGFLAGDGASHMGLSYSIRGNQIPNTFIDGTAAFAAYVTATQGAGNSGSTSASGGQSFASVAPSISPIGGSDWSRWMGGPGVNPPAIGSIDANVTFDPVAELRQTVAGTQARPATAAQRDWAIDQVERIMGGMITFGRGTPVER